MTSSALKIIDDRASFGAGRLVPFLSHIRRLCTTATPVTRAYAEQLELARGQHLWLRARRATSLTALHGTAWITFAHGVEDVVITAGQSFTAPTGAKLLIGALRGSARLLARGKFDMSGRTAECAPDISNWA